MVYIVDPTLRSSVDARTASSRTSPQTYRTVFIVFGIVIGALLIWIGISVHSSRLDTSYEETINVDARLESIPVEGRQPPIRIIGQ
jgi:capsular polysaccharide biosynthesis protein